MISKLLSKVCVFLVLTSLPLNSHGDEILDKSNASANRLEVAKSKQPFLVSIGNIDSGIGFKITAACTVVNEIAVLGPKEVKITSAPDSSHGSDESIRLNFEAPNFHDTNSICIGTCPKGFRPQFVPTNQIGSLKQAITCLQVPSSKP